MKANRSTLNVSAHDVFMVLFCGLAALVAAAALALWIWPGLEALVYSDAVAAAIAPPPYSFVLFLALLVVVGVFVYAALAYLSANAARPLYRYRLLLRIKWAEHSANITSAHIEYYERQLFQARMERDQLIGKKHALTRELNRLNIEALRDDSRSRLFSK